MKPRVEHPVIVVARERREAERNGVQAGCFRREIIARGVGAAHDQRERARDADRLEPEQLEHGVERAALALVADLDALDVERDRAGVGRDVFHLGRIDIEDARLRVDEAADQPRAGDAVDLRPPPRHPQARRFRREAVERGLRDQRQARLAPGLPAAFQHLRLHAAPAQLRRDHLAEVMPVAAASTIGRSPPGSASIRRMVSGLTPLRGGDQPGPAS